jgi:peptidoglycan/xylan/chitin deacetylase (PgdA/CDA1 family)
VAGTACGGVRPTAAPRESPAPVTTPPVTTAPAPSATPSTAAPSPTSTRLPDALSGRVIERLDVGRRVVALTFDCGSGAQGVPSILATLQRTGVSATFFLTGRFVQAYPATARTIAASHVVGNHTMTHPHLTAVGSAALRDEVTRAETAIRAAVGSAARPWFRFPFGEYDARTLAVVNDLGYAGVGWTVDTLGWKGRGAGSASDIVDRVLDRLQPGAIVLMHVGAAPDGSTLDADALPALVTAIRAAGYELTTVRALL